MSSYSEPRPTLATFFGLVSLLWGLFMFGWVGLVLLVLMVVGVGGWLAGPIIGAIGTALSAVIAVYCILSSLLSFMLLAAGWQILHNQSGGLWLLRNWLALTLLISGGLSGASYFGLIYAIAVLCCTTRHGFKRFAVAPGESMPYAPKPKPFGDPDF